MSNNKVSVTLVKSKYGRLENHQKCLAGLGLSKMHKTRIVDDTPENRGMINKISYLLKVEEVR